MHRIRTDLAAEAHTLNAQQGIDDGIAISEEMLFGVPITKATVHPDGEEKAKRRAGTYITVDIGKAWHKSASEREDISNAVASSLQALLPQSEGAVLVTGLGNEAVTPDAIGPQTVSALVVTHHMKSLNPQLYQALAFGDVAAFCPGVLGQTGIESAALIKAAAECIKPRCIIAIDALAARGLERLGTTVQISSTGIAPGSGVGGGRAELSEQTMGCPVIGLGVPTVVDARTIAVELTGEMPKSYDNFFVTPKETDTIINVASRILATAINRALHANDDIEEYAPL